MEGQEGEHVSNEERWFELEEKIENGEATAAMLQEYFTRGVEYHKEEIEKYWKNDQKMVVSYEHEAAKLATARDGSYAVEKAGYCSTKRQAHAEAAAFYLRSDIKASTPEHNQQMRAQHLNNALGWAKAEGTCIQQEISQQSPQPQQQGQQG